MTNRGSQGAAESDSVGGLERLEKLTTQGLEAIKDSISSGALKISESSVVFICNFEWDKACQVGRCLLGPKAVKDALKATKVNGKPTCIIQLCENEKAAEILSTKFGEVHLANTLKDRVFQSTNLLPVIIPTDFVMAVTYVEIPAKRQDLDLPAPADIGVSVQSAQINPERAES